MVDIQKTSKTTSDKNRSEIIEQIRKQWKEMLQYIKETYQVSDLSYDTWLKPLNKVIVDDKMVIIETEPPAVHYMKSRFSKCFQETFRVFTGEEYEVEFRGRIEKSE